MERTPRDMQEWMRSIERNLANVKRAASSVPISYYEKTITDITVDRERTPAAPVEITHQTSLYTDGVLARQYGRLMVDFPDVTKATDGTDIPVSTYELWGRDDTSNLLESTTGAVPGAAAPGLTMPGLAATQAFKDAAAASQGQWTLLATSSTSSIRRDGLVPGSIWSFRVRAMGTYTSAPGLFSQVYQAQITKDTTPPPQPSRPTVVAGRGVISVRWDGLSVLGAMPADFSHLIVAASTSSSPEAEVDRFFFGGGVTVLSDFDYYTPVFVRFQAVDLAGNKSPWSEQTVGITTPLVDTDVILSEIDGAKTVIKNVAGEALRDGAIRQNHLADNAVSQEKLADNIISAAKLETTVNDSIAKGIADAATAQGAANAANSAAGTAQTAANNAQAVVDKIIASGTSMVLNGNFESGDADWGTGAYAFTRTSAVTRSGTKVMYLAPSPGNTWPVSNYTNVVPQRSYYLEMWVRRIGSSQISTDDVGFVVQHTTTSGGTSTVIAGIVKAATLNETGLTKISYTYTVPNTIDPYRVRFAPWARASTNGYEVDDFLALDVTESKAAFDAAAAAQSKADLAWDKGVAALTAAGLAQTAADGKATVYYPNTAPAGNGYKAGDIWFRGTDNKVHIWDPAANSGAGGWVAKTDAAIGIAQQAANDAGTAAAAAKKAADDARAITDANANSIGNINTDLAAKAQAIIDANSRIDTVSQTANGKNKITYSVNDASGANTAGDIWFKKSGALIIKQWEGQGGTSWAVRSLDGATLANLDAGTITVGWLSAARIQAGTITADKLVIGHGANMLVDPSFEDDAINTLRIGTSAWTVASNTPDGKYFTFTGTTGAVVDLRLDNNSGQLFTADPKGSYSLTIDTDAAANGMQAFLVVTYADGATASGPFVKTFPGLDGTRKTSAIIWELDKLLNASGSPVRTFRIVVRRPSSVAAAAVSNIFSARFATAMTGELIVDGTITAGKVKTGELTAAHIAANSLTSASGIFGDVSAAILTSGLINADRLVAGDIRTKFLAAGKITAADMVTNTITAASGVIGSLDIGKVTTGQLDGIYIKSQTIEVQHLKVTDLENFAPSYAESPNDWTADVGLNNIATAIAAAYDKRRWSMSGVTDGVAKLARGPYKSVKAGQELYAEGTIYRMGPTTNAINLRWYFYDANKLYMTSISKTLDGVTNTPQDSANGFTQKAIAVVPDGAMYARLCLVMTNADGSDIGMYNIMGRRRNNADLIVDGSIVSEKVATNAIVAKHIVVGDFANIALGSDFEVLADVPWTLASNHTISTTQKKFGTSSLRLAGLPGSAQSSLKADTRVKEGEEWQVDYWAYIDTAFDGTTGNSKIRLGDQGNTALKHIPFAAIPRNSWQKVTDSLVIPAGVTSLTVQLWNDNTNGFAYIDNINIRRKSEASLIRNLGVEQLTASTAGIDQAVIDKLWADVVNSRKITAEMLVVTGENLMSNSYGQFGNNKDWSDWTWDGADKPNDGRVTGSFYITGGTAGPLTKTLANNQPAMPVTGDSWYVFEGYIKANVANSRVFIEFMEDNGVNPAPQYALASYVVPTTWTPFSVKVKTSVGQKSMYMRMFGNHAAGSVTTALQKIAGMRFRPAVGSDLVVDGSILANHLGVDSVTATAIKALEIQTGHLAANSVKTDKLDTGSVTAQKLEATLVLATRVLAGPANDTHAEMNSTGFKVFAKDALGNVNETVRLGVAATNDYFAVTNSAQELVTTISDAGTISSRKMVTDEFVYKGNDLQVILDRQSQGIAAWGQAWGFQLPPVLNSQERGMYELAWAPVGTRMYSVSCSPVLYTPTGGVATAAALKIRYTTDGTQPTTNSPILAEDYKPILSNGTWTMSFQVSDRMIGGFNGNYIRLLFTIAASNGNGLTPHPDQGPTFMVKDLGPAYPQSGVLSNQTNGGGGGSRPPVVTRDKYYTAVNRRSFYENGGGFYNYDTGRMYQGPSPAGIGKLASMAFFPDMTADLSGATINDIQVYIYFDHWYNNSGGIAKIGLHGHTGAMPATFNWQGWIMDSAGWPKPGGRWLRIPSQYWDGFKSGAYRGITLGINTAGYEHYGIANGSPQFFVRYTV
ncbi:tail protein [Arthrobacter phage Tank]|uniref:Tail protein n=1 Tax=Arthrobacter phage Tank TaxID=1772319 RepID=A0A0U4IPJ0_9CAUD|nr:tail protein [Arthrobacter phage Tank]ALY10570.1 tail protein [Arthrobacter phage Tank]